METTRKTVRRSHRSPLRPVLGTAAVLAVVAAATLGALGATSAAYTDRAVLNLAGDTGVGFPGRFDIGLVLPAGTVEQADGPDGYAWAVAGAEGLVPGHSVQTQIPVFNNTEALAAETTLTVVARNGNGAVSEAVPNITPFLRFTAVTSAGKVLFTDVPLADARGSLGALAARAQPALGGGAAYTPGATGSAETITLTVRYADAPGVEDLNGGQSALAVRFDATSTKS